MHLILKQACIVSGTELLCKNKCPGLFQAGTRKSPTSLHSLQTCQQIASKISPAIRRSKEDCLGCYFTMLCLSRRMTTPAVNGQTVPCVIQHKMSLDLARPPQGAAERELTLWEQCRCAGGDVVDDRL